MHIYAAAAAAASVILHDIASHSYRPHYARLRSGVRADLYVAADRRKGTVGAVQGSLRETCENGTLKVLRVHRRGRVRKFA